MPSPTSGQVEEETWEMEGFETKDEKIRPHIGSTMELDMKG